MSPGQQKATRIYLLAVATTLSYVTGAACAYWIALPLVFESSSDFGSSFAAPSQTEMGFPTQALIIVLGLAFAAPSFVCALGPIVRRQE